MGERLAIHGGKPVRSTPWPRWPEAGDLEREALERVLASGSWGGFPSPNVEAAAFAREFGEYLGAEHVVTCANGTVSLTLALQAGRISPGAEVITTGYTFVGTAGGIVGAGALPVFVDIDPDTYCIDCDAVEAAIGARTEAIMPVHLACSMADMDRLGELCERHGLLLVEDCAHAHGARWRGRCAGTIGDFGSFSMQSTKLLTAGEGGAVSARDLQHAERLAALVNCGRREPEFRTEVEAMLGHNLRMTEWQAAVLRAQLRRLPEQHERRERNLQRFERAMERLPGVEPLVRDPRITRRTAYQYIVRWRSEICDGVPRDHALLALRAEGIPCAGRFYVPLPDDELFAADERTNAAARAGARWRGQSLPRAARAAYEEAIWLPHELFLGGEAETDALASAFARVASSAAALRERPPAGVASAR